MDLRWYIWAIWCIAEENMVDKLEGCELFFDNLDAGKPVYHGADYLDYSDLGEMWADMTDEDRQTQIDLVTFIVYRLYPDLRDAYNDKNKLRFVNLCLGRLSEEELVDIHNVSGCLTWREFKEYYDIEDIIVDDEDIISDL